MRLILLLLCAVITVVSFSPSVRAQYLEQEFTASTLPEDLRAVDVPDDAGGSIGLSWKVSPGDAPDVDYIVYISRSKDGPWQEAGRIMSTTSYKSDAPEIFGFRKKQQNFHFVAIELRKVF
ncbi:MAG: fibronectin type III domain-containing protein, partial [Candidatus Brocadiales bacterium]